MLPARGYGSCGVSAISRATALGALPLRAAAHKGGPLSVSDFPLSVSFSVEPEPLHTAAGSGQCGQGCRAAHGW